MESVAIKFVGRTPKPRSAFVGMHGEHNAEKIEFTGIPEYENGIVTMNVVLPDGNSGDTLNVENNTVVLTRDYTQMSGQWTAWIVVQVGTEMVWKSDKFKFIVMPLPEIEEIMDQQYPTALEEAIVKADEAIAAAGAAARSAEDAASAVEAARDVVSNLTASANTLSPGSDATVAYENGTLIFGIPRGDKGEDAVADPEQIKQDVGDWLDDHPEATTTVQDGAITKAKLASDTKAIYEDDGVKGNQIDGEKFPVLTENLIGEFTDGKYATGKTSTGTLNTISYATADITGYSKIELTCYVAPSSVYFPLIMFGDNVTTITGSISEYETVGADTYRISVPSGYTGVHINVYTANKSSAYVKGVVQPSKELKWLKVEYGNLSADAREDLTDDVSANVSGIQPWQINRDAVVEYTDITPESESGYYTRNGKGYAPILHEQLQHFVVPVAGYDHVKCFVYNGEITQANYPNYFVTVDADGLCTSAPTVTAGDGHVYTIELPEDAETLYLTYNTGDPAKWVQVGNSVFSIDWLKLKESNFDEGCVPQSAIIPKDRYKYADSVKKPFDFSGKKIAAFGDSITSGVTSPGLVAGTPYITYFKDIVGASSVDNKAVSGQCISGTGQYAVNQRISGYTGNADFIIIAGGINDFVTSAELGELGDTTNTTVYGALYVICEFLKTNYSGTDVIFITPIPLTAAHAKHDAVNDLGYTLNDYRNAIYEMATLYGHSVVDGTALGMPEGKGGWSNLMCADTDGCHPTEAGHKLYARSLAGKLC